MHPNANAAVTDGNDLVLETLPSGEAAWLRPEPEEDVRYTITDAGRQALRDDARARAVEACFGSWPTVAEVIGQQQGNC
jgi:hypothetical protein